MNADEKLVRDTWEDIILSGPNWPCGGMAGISLPDGQDKRFIVKAVSWEKVWSASSAFTRERQREKAELRDKIDNASVDIEGYRRTLARLQSALAELTRGMKPEAINGK